MDLAAVIREIGRGATGARGMSCAEAQALYGAILDGEVPDLEQGAIAIALRMKTETVDEMVGFLAAANERLPGLARPPGALRPVLIPTYNGARRVITSPAHPYFTDVAAMPGGGVGTSYGDAFIG